MQTEENLQDFNLDEVIEKYNNLKSEYDELQELHNNTVEHGSQVENEMEEKNTIITQYVDSMKRYLSPQLFNLITQKGNEGGAKLIYKRKKITVFFSDIVDFSGITDAIEPEILSSCLNYYLDVMSKIAIKYDGTIDKFIGDAIMIFFGDPTFVSDEMHALNCVKMAIEMREKMVDVNNFWHKSGIQDELQVRMGINTGYVTVGNFGTSERMDYTLIGGQVNIASRLESFSQKGQITISHATKILIEHEIDTRSLGEVKVKGIHSHINAYEVIGLKSQEQKKLSFGEYAHNREDGVQFDGFYISRNTSQIEKEKILHSMEKLINYIKKN